MLMIIEYVHRDGYRTYNTSPLAYDLPHFRRVEQEP